MQLWDFKAKQCNAMHTANKMKNRKKYADVNQISFSFFLLTITFGIYYCIKWCAMNLFVICRFDCITRNFSLLNENACKINEIRFELTKPSIRNGTITPDRKVPFQTTQWQYESKRQNWHNKLMTVSDVWMKIEWFALIIVVDSQLIRYDNDVKMDWTVQASHRMKT